MPIDVSPAELDCFQCAIIDWFLKNGRHYPWRLTRDPFHILIAEILLKLTGAWKVESAYRSIVERYGEPQTMTAADVDDLHRLLKPLGLHRRASLLVELAHELVSRFNGDVPTTYGELISLKGVGRYIANAVLCLAFSKKVPLVDSSIARIVSRCFGYESSKPAYADNQLWEFAQELLPEEDCREYNLGLIDLGAVFCKHPRPVCHGCPISAVCLYFAQKVACSEGFKSVSS
jgi:A/G-specific adenine glycosylase